MRVVCVARQRFSFFLLTSYANYTRMPSVK